MIKVRDHMLSERIRCAICHTDINMSTPVFQSTINYGLICPRCMRVFTQDEIDIILNLFILYGGYFGQHKRDKFSLIEQLLEIVEKEGKNFNIETSNMKLLHLALLHGITPKEFNQSLETFLKD